jgi:hypothetical protein
LMTVRIVERCSLERMRPAFQPSNSPSARNRYEYTGDIATRLFNIDHFPGSLNIFAPVYLVMLRVPTSGNPRRSC